MGKMKDEIKFNDFSEIKELKLEDVKKYEPSQFLTTDFNPLHSIIPSCYLVTSNVVRNFAVYHEETLFYIFFTFPETELQIQAYEHLLQRGYVWSTKLYRFVYLNFNIKATNEDIEIIIFDPVNWEKKGVKINLNNEFIKSLKFEMKD